MKRNTFNALIEWLDGKAKTVRALEFKANAALHEDQDQIRYKHLMLEKASLLAALADDAASYTDLLPERERNLVHEELARFSQSASVAKRIGSVFYMSALLYPEDYKPDQKNDLETFVNTLKGMTEES